MPRESRRPSGRGSVGGSPRGRGGGFWGGGSGGLERAAGSGAGTVGRWRRRPGRARVVHISRGTRTLLGPLSSSQSPLGVVGDAPLVALVTLPGRRGWRPCG